MSRVGDGKLVAARRSRLAQRLHSSAHRPVQRIDLKRRSKGSDLSSSAQPTIERLGINAKRPLVEVFALVGCVWVAFDLFAHANRESTNGADVADAAWSS